MPSRDDQADATRAAILAAARETFASAGYHGITVGELAARAGVTTGALYHHFKNKKDVFRAVVEQVMTDLMSAVEPADDLPPLDALKAALSIVLDRARTVDVRIAFIEAPTVLGLEQWREIEKTYSTEALKDLLAALVESGTIARRSIPVLAAVLRGAINEATMVVAETPDSDEIRREAGELLEEILDGARSMTIRRESLLILLMLAGCGPCRTKPGRVVLNEIAARHRDGRDWVELENDGETDAILEGFLTDDRANKKKWPIKRRTLHQNDRFVVHVRLRPAGAYLAYVGLDGVVRDEVRRVPSLPKSLSYGRAGRRWFAMKPTPGAPNNRRARVVHDTYTPTTTTPRPDQEADVEIDLDHATVAVEPPELTADDLRIGPSARWPFFYKETVDCRFVYRYTPGSRSKFWCHRTTSDGSFFERRGHVVPNAVSVRDRLLIDGEGRALLDDRGRFAESDRLKVKYFDGEPEDLEVHTEVAATRILWPSASSPTASTS